MRVIIVGIYFMPCGYPKVWCGMLHTLHGMLNVIIIVYVKIVDAFQPIDTFCVLVMEIEMQGKTKEAPWHSG